MDPKELRVQRAKKLTEADEIRKLADVEKRSLTAAQLECFNRLLGEAEALLKEAEAYETLARMQIAATAAPEQRLAIITPASAVEPTEQERRDAFEHPWRYQLRAFTPERLGVPAEQCRQMALQCGMWIGAVIYGNVRCQKWVREHRLENRTMIEGVNTSGGVLVPDVLERIIFDLRLEYGAARRYCRLWPMTSDTERIPRVVGNTTAYHAGENPAAEYTGSDMSLDMVELNARKLYVLTKVSKELSEDAIVPIADLITRDAAWAMAYREDIDWIDGTGTAAYGGIIGFRTKMNDGNHAYSYVDAGATRDLWSEFTDGDLISCMAILPQYADARAAWYCSKQCWHATMIRLMAAVGGNTIATIMAGAGAQRAYLGYPVNLVNGMPSGTAATSWNDVQALVFGDMAMAATFGDRRGITVQVLNEKYATYGLIGLLFDERFDIVVHDIGDNSTTHGPIVGLRGTT